MESKVPKPSGLKRPMSVLKNLLPTDRIKQPALHSGAASLANKTFGTMSAGVQSITLLPLNKELTNLPGFQRKAERAVSPDPIGRSALQTRSKLRRSRSACDIREMRLLKRPVSTLPTIPAKNSRIVPIPASSTTVATTQRQARIVRNVAPLQSQQGNQMPLTTVVPNAINKTLATGKATSSGTVRRAAPVTANRGRTAMPAAAAAAASNNKTMHTTGAAAPKRIAPYDFKARYNDLLEKHKALKAKSEEMVQLLELPKKLEDLEEEYQKAGNELNSFKEENKCLHTQIMSQKLELDTMNSILGKTKNELAQLQMVYNKIKVEHEKMNGELVELRGRTENLTDSNAQLIQEVAECQEQLFLSNVERKELHNTIMDLRGNIRVFCRVRPPLDTEVERMQCCWNYSDEVTIEVQSMDALQKNKNGPLSFSFDQVFHPNSDQTVIFDLVSPLIQSALDGYNICIFAYGQTGSGKTYTMDGVPENPGVIPRTVDLLFDSIKNYKRLGWEYEIRATFLEIYNEVLYDLLSNEQKDMEIRMVKNSKTDIYVSNITEETVSNADRLRYLMDVAKMNRATASTIGNERSSRSHAVTKIELIGRHAGRQEISIGSINLVDLAGSESPKTSVRMNETKNINRSLSELTNVILALLQKQDHIPYRNSKLTHLLMPALGGNSKTLMFINVAPFQDCYQESVKSLRFAASVNSCKTAKAKRNRFVNGLIFKDSAEK